MASRPLAPAAAFAACALIWGSTWLAIKVGYDGIGALTGAGLRFGLAGLLVMAYMGARRIAFPRGRAAWTAVGAVAVLLAFLDYGLIYWGEQHLDSGLTAVLFATMPLLTALVATATLAEDRLTPGRAAGIVLGFLGLATVFGDSLRLDASLLVPMLAVVVAALSAGTASVATKRYGKGLHPATYTGPGMALGAPLLLAAATLAGERVALPADATTWASVLYLAVAGSAVGFLAFFWLNQQWGPTRSSLLVLFTPLIALAIGAAVRGERLGWPAALGTALVLAGVALTLRAGARAAAAEGDRPASPASAARGNAAGK